MIEKNGLLYGLIVLVAFTCCSNRATNENQSADQEQVDSPAPEVLQEQPKDSLIYIGHIEKFDDANFFYTDLYFTDDFNYDLYDEITGMGDVVFDDGETRRVRMEVEKVGHFFDLTGLKRVVLYNDKNLKLTTGRLSHLEYIEDMIEGRFVAAIQVEDADISGASFCVGGSDLELTATEFALREDQTLGTELADTLKLNADRIWSITHYIFGNQTIYSTVSADTTAYIVETIDNAHTVLYRSNSSEAIHDLLVISKRINGRPLLLTKCGMPETDMTWTNLLVFNGNEYEANKHHRISESLGR